MCDYSLYHFPNRLARDGEELTTQRFSSGCIGFVSACDASQIQQTLERPHTWQILKSLLAPHFHRDATAVCVPPGSLMRLSSIPARVRRSFDLRDSEDALFIQRSADEFTFRDGLRFQNGREVSLQELPAGLRVVTVSTFSNGGSEIAESEWEALEESRRAAVNR
jgi:hypothetical protein